MSYVPLNTGGNVVPSNKVTGESFKDRVESQEELFDILERSFKTYKADLINYKQFLEIVENVCSDIYFFTLVFLLEKRPFSKQALAEYAKIKPGSTSTTNKSNNHLGIGRSSSGAVMNPMNPMNPLKHLNSNSPITSPGKLIASPNLKSKFSPCITLSKSPVLKANNSPFLVKAMDLDSKESLNKYLRAGDKRSTTKEGINLGSKLLNKSGDKSRDSSANKIPVNRKVRNNLKNIEDIGGSKLKTNYGDSDLQITPAVKSKTNQISIETVNPLEKQGSNISGISGISGNSDLVVAQSNTGNSNNIIYFSDSDSEDNDTTNSVSCEGYLYKLTDSKKLKKIWFKLFQKDFYYFKSQSDQVHKGMHNLCGTFVKEEKPTVIDNVLYYTFSVSYPKKVRLYYADSEGEMKRWVASIKKATGYSDLMDIYEVKEKLGNGKFGLVKLGVHKETGMKAAIKIMSKKEMNNQDLELVKTEIEILRICQHPNIIRLIEVFENVDYVYAIMEYCQGGDLFSYIEKRGFRLPEQRACQIIHKLCAAIYYCHSYGVTHRDLKPENILMTDNTDEADIRLLDFGLSKIIGPNETCTEPYGTLSYVAPEVLLEKPYNKAVDLWSIGITTYLLLAGCLPFDHESSEREIARQTIHDPVRWGSIWKKLSNEAKSFVDSKFIYG